MVSKTNTSGGFASAADYLTLDKKAHEIMKSEGVRAYDKKLMIHDFEDQSRMNPRIRQNVLHVSLSHHPDDRTKIAGKENEIIDLWLSGMKKKGIDFEKTQFAIIKHNDRAHPHYHLIANMVDNNGKRFNIDYIGLKAKDVSKQVTRAYGLTIASLKERELAVVKQRENKPEMKAEIKIKVPEKNQDMGYDRGM
jgi:phage anti-repressor protein